jgi:hypothetical protein
VAQESSSEEGSRRPGTVFSGARGCGAHRWGAAPDQGVAESATWQPTVAARGSAVKNAGYRDGVSGYGSGRGLKQGGARASQSVVLDQVLG